MEPQWLLQMTSAIQLGLATLMVCTAVTAGFAQAPSSLDPCPSATKMVQGASKNQAAVDPAKLEQSYHALYKAVLALHATLLQQPENTRALLRGSAAVEVCLQSFPSVDHSRKKNKKVLTGSGLKETSKTSAATPKGPASPSDVPPSKTEQERRRLVTERDTYRPVPVKPIGSLPPLPETRELLRTARRIGELNADFDRLLKGGASKDLPTLRQIAEQMESAIRQAPQSPKH